MIIKIKTRNKNFDLLQDMQKNLGEFYPNTTLDEVVTIIKKEKANVKGTPKASIKVRQSFNSRKRFVGKDEKATEKKKTDGLEDTSDKVSPK
tara:strand:- start:1273 stop:1548 length:276 start_codon:yes stop_codon:yes gene_type:complete